MAPVPSRSLRNDVDAKSYEIHLILLQKIESGPIGLGWLASGPDVIEGLVRHHYSKDLGFTVLEISSGSSGWGIQACANEYDPLGV
jgi:hypothetical protein